ncbi:MAG: RNA polymerase sigma factor [Acidimicrobiales bacterium]
MADLAEWLRDWYDDAYRTARLILRNPADAEEAVQEAFLRAWRFRAALPDGDGVRPWLYRVLVNACHSALRREIPIQARTCTDEPLAAVAGGELPEEAAARAESARLVAAAVADLPDHLRLPVVLRYWSGLSEREISVAVRRRPGTVKSRLHEARRRLANDPRLVATPVTSVTSVRPISDTVIQGDQR